MAIIKTGLFGFSGSKRTEELYVSGAQVNKTGPIVLKPLKGRAIKITSLTAQSQYLPGFNIVGSKKGNIVSNKALTIGGPNADNYFSIGAESLNFTSGPNVLTGNLPSLTFGIDEVVTLTWSNYAYKARYSYVEVQ